MELHKIDKGINLTDLEYFRMHGTLTEDRMYNLLNFDKECAMEKFDLDRCDVNHWQIYDDISSVRELIFDLEDAIKSWNTNKIDDTITEIKTLVETIKYDSSR